MSGICGETAAARVARAALHPWEEPIISGTRGSGTVFFVGCSLGCVYCQNAEISHVSSQTHHGREVSVERLADIFVELQDIGAHNINLVTPTHFAPHIVTAVTHARSQGLTIPIVYNTSGYERSEVIAALDDVVDVWLTDFKYADADLARAHAHASDYPLVAAQALARMRDGLTAAGGRCMCEDGTLRHGIVIRHLLLPGAVHNAEAVLDTIYQLCGTDDVDVSVMNQYTPTAAARTFGPPLDRAVSDAEYEHVLNYADDLGFEHVWWQEGGTVSESFIPDWDNAGV